jgi:RNA methyltransferase, TrmH family
MRDSMITSKDNEKLKLVRKLRDRKHRERERLFATEGEDLLDAGLAAGREPEFALVAAGSGLDGEEVEPALLDGVSSLGSGTRAIAVWHELWAEPSGPVCTYLHGVADPGNVGAIIRSAAALVEGSVVLGPGCADPHGPKATRASMGAVFSTALARGDVGSTTEPRIALVAHGGSPPDAAAPPLTLCLGAEREGLPPEVLDACSERWTIPVRPGAESLNVAAAGAIALQRISSATVEGVPNG